jgi:hypothetical protein
MLEGAGQSDLEAGMKSAKSIGRVTGVLLLVHLAVGLWVPFVLLQRLKGPTGFLASAAANAGQVRAAVFLLFVGSAVATGIAIAAWPVFRRYSPAMGLWLVALGVAAFSLQAVDNGALMSMLSLSQESAKAGAAKADLFQALGLVVGSARRWAHYTYLLVAVSWILLLYSLVYRFRLVPRALAAFGVVASVLQIAAVTLRSFLGYPPEMQLAMPLAPAYIALAIWLMVKGFYERQHPVRAEVHDAEVVEMV